MEGIEVDSNINNLVGCHDISNAVTVTKLTGDDCGNGLLEPETLELRALQNPISEELILDLNSEKSMGIGQLTVRNLEGQTILTKSIRMVEDLYQQIQLDLNSLREGMYFVSVRFPGGMKTIKIIKQ